MRYKVGDKIKIRTWEAMEVEFGRSSSISLRSQHSFTQEMEDNLTDMGKNRILTIEQVVEGPSRRGGYYRCNDPRKWLWGDDVIECKIEESVETMALDLSDRFELMDME